jgi:hypothetical protein
MSQTIAVRYENGVFSPPGKSEPAGTYRNTAGNS